MKSFELKISLIQKKKRIMRTLLVSKKTTYEQLHEMIQLLFNLDCTEAYSFELNKETKFVFIFFEQFKGFFFLAPIVN